MTDLDLLAYDISPRLELIKRIGEAKSGTGKSAPKPLDRAIWLAGLMRLVDAERAELVTALKPSQRVRETVAGLGVRAISTDDLARWEDKWIVSATADVGAHGPTAFLHVQAAKAVAKEEPELERVFWFLRSEVWFLDSWQAFKRLLGALRSLRRWWTPELDDSHTFALRWLYAEAVSVLSLHLVALVGLARAHASTDVATLFRDKLSEGAVPTHQMRALSDAFDRYLARVLREAGASSPLQVESMGAFVPRAPEWTEPLLELVERLSGSAALVHMPRYMDLVIHERLVHRRHVDAGSIARLHAVSEDDLARERRQFAAFLRSAVDLPEAVSRALTS